MKLLTAIVVAIFLAVPNLKERRSNSFRGLRKRNAKLAAEMAKENVPGQEEA